MTTAKRGPRPAPEYQLRAGDPVGPDVDLDAEEVTEGGQRLTAERADRIAEEALTRARATGAIGRPSLSDEGGESPRVQFRVPRQYEDAARARAAAEGVSLSQLGRIAFERLLKEAS